MCVQRFVPRNICEHTLKVIRLAIHEDVVGQDNTEDAGPQVQVAE